MIRVLVMIAVAGFVLAAASLSAAFALGGPDLVSRGGWSLVSDHWGHDWDNDDGGTVVASGPQATRTLSWSGGDELEIDVSADVVYTQRPGAASVTVTGPQSLVDRLQVEGDRIHLRGRDSHGRAKLKIAVNAPSVTRFDLSGASDLRIVDYNQPSLTLDLSGATDVTASGQTEELRLEISGSGEADLGQLKARGANVDVSGAGEVTIAPSEWATLEVSGAGEINLLTRPTRLETDISGVGTINQPSPATPAPAPAQAPTPTRT